LERLRFSVSEDESGERLDQFVARLTGTTRTQAQRLISEGCVKVDGENLAKNHRLHAGEAVEVDIPEPLAAEPAPRDIPLNIIYQDGDLVVVSKPAGMVVHPAAGHREDTLVNALLFAIDDLSGVGGVMRPGIVHRLDRDTSGLMVVAKNDRSHLALQRMVKDRDLKRTYLTLVHGVPSTRLGTVDAPIGRDPGDRKRMAVTKRASRPSVTEFKVIRDLKECALLEVDLVTGRTHQIRVHLAYIGHAVVGDPVYGTRGALERTAGLERQFLHAFRLAFPHPTSGDEMVFEDPLPADLEQALRRLEVSANKLA
jgi:23S rRNA pseudouridine1911/1915/1917 synthase